MKHRNLLTGFVWAGMALLLVACAPENTEVQVEKAAAGSTLTLNVDQMLAVKLESNPTTGYGWHVIEVDETIMQSQGDPEYVQQDTQGTPMVGVGGWETLRFKALQSGTTTLKLGYSRSFEPDVAPIEEFTLTVVVK